MRKLSHKWPLWLTLIAFSRPIFYVFFRYGKPDTFNDTQFLQTLFGAAFISIIVWLVYGIACLFARNWVNCGKCAFADVIQDSKEVKCRITGYAYPTTYSCKKSKSKEVDEANRKIDNR